TRYRQPAVRATLALLSDGYRLTGRSSDSAQTSRPPRPAARSMPEPDGITRAIPFIEQLAGVRQPADEPEPPVPQEPTGSALADQTSDRQAIPPDGPGEPDRHSEPGAELPPVEIGWPTDWAGL